MSGSFDAIVVGGGPAGAAAAIACRQHGLATLLLEADITPPERPGETLHPGVKGIFQRLGVSDEIERAGFARHSGQRVIRGARSEFHAYGALGYQAVRSRLDGILLHRARALGAHVRIGSPATEMLVEDGQPAGVRAGGEEWRSKFVIDAAGRGHWLQRHLGLALLQVSDPLIARFGWSEGEGDTPEFRVEGCGWRWEAPVGAGRRAWVSLRLDGGPGDGGQGRDVTWRLARPCAGAGYFLAGDAACVIDPASSHGVLRALESGIRAADAIAAGEGSESYCAWMESWFCADARTLADLYAEFDPAPGWLALAREALRYITMNPRS